MADGDAALSGVLPFVIEGAVLFEVAHQAPGHLAQPLRSQAAGHLRKLGFGGLPRTEVDVGRQLGHEVPDHRHMLSSDLAACLRCGGVRKQGFQRFAGNGASATECSGLGDSAAGIHPADPQPVRQHGSRGLGAHLRRGGLRLDLGDQCMFDSGLAAPMDFQPSQRSEGLRGGERPYRQRSELVPGGIELIESSDNRLGVESAGLHNSNTSSSD